jgi:aspartate racemase
VFRPETRDGFAAVASRLSAGNAIDGVILGGTELPLLLRSATIGGVPALDTTGIHIRAIVARLESLGGGSEPADAE